MVRREPVSYKFPGEEDKEIVSREYKIFRKEEKEARTPISLYEKACRFAERLNIEPDEKSRKKMQEAIDFSHLRVTPTGVMSFTMAFMLATFVPSIIITITGLIGFVILPFGYGMLMLLICLPFVYYLYNYPYHYKKVYEMRAGSEIVTMIIYMSMYIRNMPNLEGALRFASENLTGPLAFELRKLMWDVETGRYVSIQDALTDYTSKWKNNKEFVEAVETLIVSLKETGQRRLNLIDESINIMLKGEKENANHYNQSLKMPVTIVHAMGVILPAMGLVFFPIISVFLGVSSETLFIGYDILLPMVLYFVINNIMERRPATFSRIDISESPDNPPEGKFMYDKKNRKYLPAWPFGLATGVFIFMLGIIMFLGIEGNQNNPLPPILMLGGIATGFAVYYLLLSTQRIEIRNNIRKIESEFAESLFQLGSRVSSGVPIELSLEQSIKRIENLKIKDLYKIALRNIKYMGMTFEQAFFDKKSGAVRYYPSRLIKSIMRTITESARKGVQTSSLAMLSVSRYLKGLHNTQEEVKAELSDTSNSLKFQLYLLSPLISGIIVTMGIIILKILKDLSASSTAMGTGGIPIFGEISNMTITTFQFIIIVGVYVIETCFIVSNFISNIEQGDDPIGAQNIKGNSLLIGYIVFSICLFATLMLFGPLTNIGI